MVFLRFKNTRSLCCIVTPNAFKYAVTIMEGLAIYGGMSRRGFDKFAIVKQDRLFVEIYKE
jgi:hypothetical protein